MDLYARHHGAAFPATPPRHQTKQRHASADYNGHLPLGVTAPRVKHNSARYSLPAPGSRDFSPNLPSPHRHRQATPPTSTAAPHYATPTRVRQLPAGSPQNSRPMQANLEQWESLRSRGLVLRGTREGTRASVAFAPQLCVIPVGMRAHLAGRGLMACSSVSFFTESAFRVVNFTSEP